MTRLKCSLCNNHNTTHQPTLNFIISYKLTTDMYSYLLRSYDMCLKKSENFYCYDFIFEREYILLHIGMNNFKV